MIREIIATTCAVALAGSALAQNQSGGNAPTGAGGFQGSVQVNSSGAMGSAGLGPGNRDSGQAIAASPFLAPVSNNWYYGAYVMISGSAAAAVASTIACQPFIIPTTITIKALGVRINGASAGGNIQLAVYSNVGGFPASVLASTANISTTTATNVNASVTAATLTPGVYWGCSNADNSTVALQGGSQSNGVFGFTVGGTQGAVSGSSSALFTAYKWSQTFGTWPSLSSTGSSVSNNVQGPLIQMEAQ